MNRSTVTDAVLRAASITATVLECALVVAMIAGLALKSFPVARQAGLAGLLFSSDFRPQADRFGLLAFIAGTGWVTVLAMLFVVPAAILSAAFLSEFAPARFRSAVIPVVDLLAGIPSVVFGLCGLLVVVPFVRDVLSPAVGVFSTGYCVLSGGVVLAVMVLPIVISMSVEVFSGIPMELRESALSLGTTRWEMVKLVVLRKAAPGLVVAMVLGFGRAIGETMAVLMVVGNVARIPRGIFTPGYPLPALIANNYGELLSVPVYESALMFAAVVLLALSLVFNVGARLVLRRIREKIA